MTPDIRKERETALYEAALRLIAKGVNPAAVRAFNTGCRCSGATLLSVTTATRRAGVSFFNISPQDESSPGCTIMG